ncbi:MAG: hypothetical protein KDA28_09375, partial [Phycisphaerales bacterium]|nr:hypothetical protein [Phycisphaerales bacterium]
ERPLAEVLSHEDVREAIRRAVTRGASGRQAVEVANEDASTVLRFGIRPMRNTEGALVLIEDVTQQRIADEARNGFVAQATHELRTPLTNIRLYLEEAIDAPEDDVRARTRAFDVIGDECRRLERIVTDMLSASEIEAGALSIRPGDVRLDAVFEDLEKDYAAQAREKEIILSFDLPPKLPVIQGDRDKLVMALHNIIGNALKYTPTGGEVTVGVNYDNDMLQVDVKDSGIGIDDEDAAHIFDKFYRARDKRIAHVTGTGLGLAIAREVIRLHGGDITVQSELNKGSTFSMLVPQRGQAA